MTTSPNGVRQPDIPVGDYPDSSALEPSFDQLVIGVKVVVAEHGKLTQRGGERGEAGGDPLDVGASHRHEITAEEQYVGLHGRQCGARVGKDAAIGHCPGVEIRRKSDAQYWTRPVGDGPMRAQSDFRRADSTLQSERVCDSGRPVSRAKQGLEHVLDRPPVFRVAALAGSVVASVASVIRPGARFPRLQYRQQACPPSSVAGRPSP